MTTTHVINGIHCIIKLPKITPPEKGFSVAILIHGWGGDETVMRFFDQMVPDTVAIIRPRAPIYLEDEDGYGWFDLRGVDEKEKSDAMVAAINRLVDFCKILPQQHPIDAERILLIGFSQGGIMSNYVALTQPELIMGIAPLAAKIREIPETLTVVENLNNFPVFIAHGLNDDVIPIEEGRAARDLFIRLNANVTYGEYTVGHKMNTQAVKDLKTWVHQQFGQAHS
ncbi:MAG: hypothetical protein AAF629_06935 [Chloroflexota bacterium]